MKIIHIHIGQPKTGSSTIQRFLKTNKNALIKNSFFYDTSYNSNTVNHQQLIHNIINNVNSTNDLEKYLEQQFRNADKLNCDNIILSAESLFFMPYDKIKKLFEKYTESIIVYAYLRRQDEFLESSWKQWHYKNLSYQNFNNYMSKHKIPNYLNHLDKWSSLTVSKTVNVTGFQKINFPDGLERHFLNQLNIEDDSHFNYNIQDDGWGENKGLSNEGLRLAFMVRELANNNIHDHSIQYFINKHFKYLLKNHFEKYNLLSFSQRQQIIQHYAHINEKISQNYNNNKPVFNYFDVIDQENHPFQTSQDFELIIKELFSIGIKQDKLIKQLKK